MEKYNSKKTIWFMFVVLAFVLGLFSAFFTDALFGDRINIHIMSQVESKEKSVSQIEDDALFEEKLIDLIDDCYSIATDYDLMTSAFYSELYYIDEKGVAYEEGAKSNSLKGFLLDLKENRLKLYYDDILGYSVAPDLEYFLLHYEARLSDVTKEYLKFRADDMEEGLYDPNLNTLSMDKAVEKIDFINAYISTYGEEGEFYSAYSQLKDYYLGIFDGSQHNFYINYEKNTLSPYAKKKYKEYSLRNDEIGEKARENLLLYGGDDYE